MDLSRLRSPRPHAMLAGALLVIALAQSLSTAVTITDFGYQRMHINGELAIGTRPLLVILCNFAGGNPSTTTVSNADWLIFNPANTQSLNGFFREISNGRFSWTNAGIVGPVTFNANERMANFTGDYFSNKLYKALTSLSFNLAPFDDNGDTNVTPNELQIMVISNDPSNGVRPFNNVKLPYTPYVVASWGNSLIDVADALDGSGTNYQFFLFSHETTHSVGAVDLYGTDQYTNETFNTTGMRAARSGTDTFHLDPWHKMQIGWCEPRLVDLRTGGVYRLPAAPMRSNNAPLILHDPRRGTEEFFMLEYRTPISPALTNYDRNVISTGLVVWHIKQDANKGQTLVPPFWTGVKGEFGWAECTNCHSIYYQMSETNSFCPSNNTNHYAGGGNYQNLSMLFDFPDSPWRRCWKCMALFQADNPALSNCPRDGGTHDGAGSRSYSVSTNAFLSWVPTDSIQAVQPFPFYRCTKCQGLVSGPRLAQSDCPQDSFPHTVTLTATNYLPTYDQGVFTLGAPDLTRNGADFWSSDTTTPTLVLINGTPTRTTIRVRPFTTGSGDITVEVLCAEDTWVDFNYAGSPRNGSFSQPYNTLAEGVSKAAWGGVLNFKPAASSETALITKPLTLVGPNGTVTIGQ